MNCRLPFLISGCVSRSVSLPPSTIGIATSRKRKICECVDIGPDRHILQYYRPQHCQQQQDDYHYNSLEIDGDVDIYPRIWSFRVFYRAISMLITAGAGEEGGGSGDRFNACKATLFCARSLCRLNIPAFRSGRCSMRHRNSTCAIAISISVRALLIRTDRDYYYYLQDVVQLRP